MKKKQTVTIRTDDKGITTLRFEDRDIYLEVHLQPAELDALIAQLQVIQKALKDAR